MFVQDEFGFDGAVTVTGVEAHGKYLTATMRIPYLDIRGEPAEVQARVTARFDLLTSGKPMPAFCQVFYEPFIDEIPGPEHWCDRGWLVAAPHYPAADGVWPEPDELGISNGVNHTRALIQWVRRLPFVDRQRVHLNGASQAGYMVLAAAASSFPVTSATSFYPVVNWAYNLRYFEANRPITQNPPITPPEESPMPIMGWGSTIYEISQHVFGTDFHDEAYYTVSPVSYHDRITSPTLVVCATGDMLVPLAQMNPKREAPVPPGTFPDGYMRDFETLSAGSQAKRPFEELLSPDTFWTADIPLPEGTLELTRDQVLGREPMPAKDYRDYVDLPWSPDHQWSMLYLDEGAPTPHVGHTRYHWRVTFDSFVEAHRDGPVSVGLLTAPKLKDMMARYVGESPSPELSLVDGTPVNRRNFDGVECRDVLTGLLDYASTGAAHAERLDALYEALPGRLKFFGADISIAALEEALKPLANGAEQNGRNQ